MYGIPRLLPGTRCLEYHLPGEFACWRQSCSSRQGLHPSHVVPVWVGGILNYFYLGAGRGETIFDVAINPKVTPIVTAICTLCDLQAKQTRVIETCLPTFPVSCSPLLQKLIPICRCTAHRLIIPRTCPMAIVDQWPGRSSPSVSSARLAFVRVVRRRPRSDAFGGIACALGIGVRPLGHPVNREYFERV